MTKRSEQLIRIERENRSWTEIDLGAFKANFNALRSFVPGNVQILQIVKADAYGHGAAEIAAAAEQCGVTMLGVANAEEGGILRYRGIQLPILVLSPSLLSEIELIKEYDLIPTVSEIGFAEALNREVEFPFRVHVEIDTGMGRSGVHHRDALTLIEQLKHCSNLVIDGIFSHYSAAENDPEYSAQQQAIFESLWQRLQQEIRPRFIHLSNSSAVLTMPFGSTNLVRLGLLAYGVYTDPSLQDRIALRPVMTFKTRIGHLKQAQKGESIGYNRTFIAERELRYAILPVGYADGYDSLLRNRAQVEIHGRLCPVIGKISMDMTAVELPDDLTVNIGDEVTMIGGEQPELHAENLTELYGGNPYELLCQIGRRARRFYIEDGRLISTSPHSRREFYSKDFSDDRLNLIIEAAIGQRLQSKEIASLIYSDILRQFFLDHDREIHYRSNFEHLIRFSEDSRYPGYYRVNTTLSFTKKLQNDFFTVACANSPDVLNRYFMRRDCEYRWLLDEQFELNEETFSTSVRIDEIPLTTESHLHDGCVEIRCSHPSLKDKVGKEVRFEIATVTWYPKRSHQLSVFITEITRGVRVEFEYPMAISDIEVVTIFAGRRRFPLEEKAPGRIRVATDSEEWVFPNSGIIFSY